MLDLFVSQSALHRQKQTCKYCYSADCRVNMPLVHCRHTGLLWLSAVAVKLPTMGTTFEETQPVHAVPMERRGLNAR